MPFFQGSGPLSIVGGTFNDISNEFNTHRAAEVKIRSTRIHTLNSDARGSPNSAIINRRSNADSMSSETIDGTLSLLAYSVAVYRLCSYLPDTEEQDLQDLETQLAELRARIQAKRTQRTNRDRLAAELAGAQAELANLDQLVVSSHLPC